MLRWALFLFLLLLLPKGKEEQCPLLLLLLLPKSIQKGQLHHAKGVAPPRVNPTPNAWAKLMRMHRLRSREGPIRWMQNRRFVAGWMRVRR